MCLTSVDSNKLAYAREVTQQTGEGLIAQLVAN